MNKKKMLVFHSALAPYRIDQFNSLSELFDLEIVFYLKNVQSFKYDQDYLKKQCNFKISYLLVGPGKKKRFFRFGIYRKIRKSNPDYIIGYEYSLTTLYLISLKKTGIISQKIGSIVDDSLNICLNPQTKLRKYLRNFAVKQLDFLVLLSHEVAEYYRSKFNLELRKTIVIPLLQDADRLRLRKHEIEKLAEKYLKKYVLKNKIVLLYVGRLAPEKGLINFLKNISTELKKNDSLKIVLVGDGSEKGQIKELRKEKNLEKKIILPGRFENLELYSWYVCASGFFLPSTFEPYGAVVNEALIFGRRVLCSQFAGATSILNSDISVIFNPLNESDSVEKFKQFINMLEPVIDVDLNKTPSLIEDYHDDFKREWMKLSSN